VTNIKYCSDIIYNLGYSKILEPTLIKKVGRSNLSKDKQYNYRIVTYTFTNFNWIYDAFRRKL